MVETKFKQTDVGLIPEDWEVKSVGEIGEIRMCKRVMKYETSEICEVPFYKIGTFGGIPDAYITYELFREYRDKYSYPKKGDILVSAAGTIGRTVIFDGNPSYFQDSNIVWVENNEKIVTNKFLYYIYQTIDWNTSDTTIKRLYNDNFRGMRIPLPSLKEQERIASALTSIDNLISSLDKQIAKTRNIKQGAMQQLLTFPDNVPLRPLGEVCDFTRGQGMSKQDRGSGDIPIILYGELYTTYGNYINNVVSKASYKVVQNSPKVIKGDLVLPISSTTKEAQIGKVSAYCCEYDAYLGSDAILLKHNQVSGYLVHLLNSPWFENKKMPYTKGITINHLDPKGLSEIKIPLPTMEYQYMVADILLAMDNQIATLEAKRRKYEMLKQGMMQQLLTGKIRLGKSGIPF